MGRTFKVGQNIRVVLNDDTFREIRKTARLESILVNVGSPAKLR